MGEINTSEGRQECLRIAMQRAEIKINRRSLIAASRSDWGGETSQSKCPTEWKDADVRLDNGQKVGGFRGIHRKVLTCREEVHAAAWTGGCILATEIINFRNILIKLLIWPGAQRREANSHQERWLLATRALEDMQIGRQKESIASDSWQCSWDANWRKINIHTNSAISEVRCSNNADDDEAFYLSDSHWRSRFES